MVCPKCGSANVNVTVINEAKLKRKHGFVWWLFIGWWWRLIWFIVFGWWYLLFRLIRGNKKIVNVQKTVAVCQNCGHSWKI